VKLVLFPAEPRLPLTRDLCACRRHPDWRKGSGRGLVRKGGEHWYRCRRRSAERYTDSSPHATAADGGVRAPTAATAPLGLG
jgi:hypothetical protein